MPRLEYRASKRRSADVYFFEAEQRGTTVLSARGGSEQKLKQTCVEYADEDQAYAAFSKLLLRFRKSGYVPAGEACELPGSKPARQGSAILVDVYFAEGAPRFLEELLAFDGGKKLSALAQPWFEDARPFARRALLDYVADGCDRPGHKALVKRLFKLAEAAHDHELLAVFMVAFDRLTRRVVAKLGWKWDPVTRQGRDVFGLQPDLLVPERLEEGKASETFTRATRRYLARRAFRYFRRLGFRDPVAYRRAVLLALPQYREEHLNTVGKLLSAWSLLHVLYGRSPVLKRGPLGIRIAPPRTLAELAPEPIFSKAWDDAFQDLWPLLLVAKSRPVRSWALGMLRARYGAQLASLGFAQIKELMLSEAEEAQVLGAEAFAKMPGIESVSLSDWMELLGSENLDILGMICDRAASSVSGARLTLAQCVQLALSPTAPLASLGFTWLKEKRIASAVELEELLRLRGATVAAVRADAAQLLGELLQALAFTTPLHVRDLCDAAHVDVRGHGLRVAVTRFGEDATLWAALCESPYPDVRSFVVHHAEQAKLQSATSLAQTFGSVLCALSGAAVEKRRVAREITERVVQSPDDAAELLPLLRVTLGSVHPTERTLSLSALARVAHRPEQQQLRELIQARFPELSIAQQASE